MSERKYTDEEIIKALECCWKTKGCLDCPYIETDGCIIESVRDTLKLINRQKADVDKLQEVNADLNESLRLAAEANKDLNAEIERLKKYNTDVAFKHYNDGIREFAERVINLIYSADDINPVTEWQIDNLVAEMTEETK